jgi:hypothetical protein
MSRGSPADITPFARFLEWRQRHIEQAALTAPATLIATGEDLGDDQAPRVKGCASPCQTSVPVERVTDVGTGVF